MGKLIRIITVFMSILAINQELSADIYADIDKCVEIKNASQRLNCFDALSKNNRQTSNVPSSENELSANVSKVVQNHQVIQPTPMTASIATPMPEQKAEMKRSAFGLKKVPGVKEVTSIESNLVGQFATWNKGMKLVLENGQVWKVLQRSTGYMKLQNPKVTITKGFFGSFNASVEGLNSQAKVKRIK